MVSQILSAKLCLVGISYVENLQLVLRISQINIHFSLNFLFNVSIQYFDTFF